MSVRRSSRPFVFLALAAALAASACNKPGSDANETAAANSSVPLPSLPATLPMATGAPTAAAFAPPVTALPATRPIRTVRVARPGDDYAYADDAYGFSNALGNAPPDYGFDYQGTEPWAWQGYDQSRTFVEPVEGGYRYYYYRPGAATPYFVRDPDYGYGYADGSLAVIYGAGGAVLPYAEYGPRLGYASRYLQRGEALYEASRGNERRAVNAANWATRQNAIAASRDRWAEAAARQAGWQAYRARVADQQAQHWAQEASRRDADARSFAAWHDDSFRSAPPPRAIPAAWQQAPWAQNQQRYRVADRAPPQPASQRQTFNGQADPGRQAFAPQGPAGPYVVPGQARAAHFVDARGPGVSGEVASQRAAADTAHRQAEAAQVQQQQAARASEQQQREAERTQQQQALASRQQLQGERQQQQAAARVAQQQVHQQQMATIHAQQDASRQAHQEDAVVHIHRSGGDTPVNGRSPLSPQRQPEPPRSQPQHDDQQQAEHAMRREQAAAHQQQAAAQHAVQQVQHAPPPPHAAIPPRPVPAPHPAAAPHPQGGEYGGHGEHHP